MRVSDEGEPLSVVLKRHVACPEGLELAATLRHVVDDGQVYEFRLRFSAREAIPPKTPEELREEAEDELWRKNPLGAYMQLLA
jgi:hypothetical protein